MNTLQEHGCIWFRGFDLMKDPEGFRSFYDVRLAPLLLPPPAPSVSVSACSAGSYACMAQSLRDSLAASP